MHSRLINFVVLFTLLITITFSETSLTTQAAEVPPSPLVQSTSQPEYGRTFEIPPAPTSPVVHISESEAFIRQEMQAALSKWLATYSYPYKGEINDVFIQDNWAYTAVEPVESNSNTASIYILAHYTPGGQWTVSLPGWSEDYSKWLELIPNEILSTSLKSEAHQSVESLLNQGVDYQTPLLINGSQIYKGNDTLFEIPHAMQTYVDPLYHYRLSLPGDWIALPPIVENSIYGVTVFIKADYRDVISGTFPLDTPKIQIGISPLLKGQSFDRWVEQWQKSMKTTDELKEYRYSLSGSIPSHLNNYQGVQYQIDSPFQPPVLEIVLKSDDQVAVIGISPVNETNISAALKILDTLELNNQVTFPEQAIRIADLWYEKPILDTNLNPTESNVLTGTCTAGTFPGTEAPSSPITLFMPFTNGETWIVGGAGSFYGNGYHCNSNNDYYATDWNIVGGDDNGRAVFPVADGTITGSQSPTCPTTGFGCYVQIDHGSGVRTLYGHLSSVSRASGTVNHYEQVGNVGSTGYSSGPHLHLRFQQNNSGYYSLCWNNGSTCPNGEPPISPQSPKPSPIQTASGTQDIQDGHSYTSNNTSSGGFCSAPSQTEPADNAVLNNSTITFRWNAVSGCTFNGYTFRVCTTSNMDDLGSCFIDTGEGGTQRTEVINGHDNQDLYWGVKAANAPSGATWAVRHFRIEPASSCSPGSSQVSLYVDSNFTGQCVTKDIGNYSDPSAIGLPDDAISSVRVGSNVKAILCQYAGYGGTCDTFTSDDPYLGDNGVGDNSVSSAKVELRGSSTEVRLYDGTNYDGGYAWVTLPGLYTLVPNFNDQAESISMPAGWSVRLFEHDAYNEPEVCIQGNDSNLWDNYYSSSGNSAANSATWFEAYNQSSCPPLGYPPSAPTLISPSNGSSFSDQTSISLVWSPSNGASEYNAHLWGPGVDIYSGWVGSTDYTVGTLGIGTYSWQAKARNQFGESGWSSTWSFTITSGCSDTYEPNNSDAQSTNISYNQTIQGDICPGDDLDYYHFTGTAGIPTIVDIDAQVNGSVLDSVVLLYDQNGALLASSDDDGYTFDSKVGFTLPASGDYYIAVRDYNSSNGGAAYYYSMKLYTDNVIPYLAAITNPLENSWIDPTSVDVTASTGDEGSGIRGVDFYWYSPTSGQWQYLGYDGYGVDGWNYIFNTISQPESTGGALYIFAYDYGWNYLGSGIWNLGIDRTPPSISVSTRSLYGGASFRQFFVEWDEVDNLTYATDFDAQYKDGAGGSWIDWITDTTYDRFLFLGQDGHTYYFQVKAHDLAGNESVYPNGNGMAQHSVQVCPILQDGFEADNNVAFAKSIIPDSAAQQHNIHEEQDQDWVKFSAIKDKTYVIGTHNIGGYADTQLYLYGVDGTTLLDFNDDAPGLWPESRISWKATDNGTFYIKVDHHNQYAFGCETMYSLDIISNYTLFIPLLLR